MVAGLFLLALLSFAVMGLFLVGLTVYGNLRNRAERADRARDALVTSFSSQQLLLPEFETLTRDLTARAVQAGASESEPTLPGPPPSVPSTGLEEWVAFDRAFLRFAGDALARASRLEPDSPRVGLLQTRLSENERAIADALRAYNSAATEFNDARRLVPAAVIARVAALSERVVLASH